MEKNREKLTKRIVDAAQSQEQRTVIWDNKLPGFGLRITPNGLKTFILRYRPKGRSEKRYLTLGRYGSITVEEARARAREMLGAVAFGKDPAQEATLLRQSPTLAEVCTDFLSSHVDAKRKPKTAASYRHAISYHVLPQLGRLRIHEVTRRDIEGFHSSLAAKPAMANYAIAVIASMYGWAEGNGIVRKNFNPAQGIPKYRENRRERFLTRDEFARLGAALVEAETVGIPYEVDESRPTAKHAAKPENRRVFVAPDAVGAMRLLMLTGCRLREILNLRWQEVDFERGLVLLPDSKTGRKTIVLGAPAITILKSLPRAGEYVISGGTDATKPRGDLKRPWSLITRRAGLMGLRVHDLRHSYASVAVGAGLGLPIVAKLLGHSQLRTTERYAHLGDDPMRVASEAISGKIAAAMKNGGNGEQ